MLRETIRLSKWKWMACEQLPSPNVKIDVFCKTWSCVNWPFVMWTAAANEWAIIFCSWNEKWEIFDWAWKVFIGHWQSKQAKWIAKLQNKFCQWKILCAITWMDSSDGILNFWKCLQCLNAAFAVFAVEQTMQIGIFCKWFVEARMISPLLEFWLILQLFSELLNHRCGCELHVKSCRSPDFDIFRLKIQSSKGISHAQVSQILTNVFHNVSAFAKSWIGSFLMKKLKMHSSSTQTKKNQTWHFCHCMMEAKLKLKKLDKGHQPLTQKWESLSVFLSFLVHKDFDKNRWWFGSFCRLWIFQRFWSPVW